MATDATSLRARGTGVVLRVIEPHVESFVEACGEILEGRIVAADVGVADNAHRDRRRCELAAVTISAGFMTGEARRCGVVGSFVTRVAGEGTVALARVHEFGVIELRTLGSSCDREYSHNADDTDDTDSE